MNNGFGEVGVQGHKFSFGKNMGLEEELESALFLSIIAGVLPELFFKN